MSTASGGHAAPATTMRLVNGVFRGGGAKGIAYAGALQALRQRGLWFGSVAGTSAGAITAALVAAGMDPDELQDAVPDALAAIKASLPVRLGQAIIGHANSIYDGAGLRRWLETTLANRVGQRGGAPVTFTDLHRATGIELYVVAVDLASGLPVVFSRRTTPDIDVAGAVLASAAIPAGFPPGRAVFGAARGGVVVHQLVDGAMWANHPDFVFRDRGFRTWMRGEAERHPTWNDDDEAGWSDEERRPTVGLALGQSKLDDYDVPIGLIPPTAKVNRRFDQGPAYTSSKTGTFLFGATLSSDWVRLTVVVAMSIVVAMTLVTLPVGARRYSTWLADWVPDVLYPFVLVGTMAIVVFSMATTIALVIAVIVVSRIVAETMLPVVQGVVKVPTGLPPWFGLGNDTIVLRVPYGELSLLDFEADPEVAAAVVRVAHDAVAAQLDDEHVAERLDALFEGREPAAVPARSGATAPHEPDAAAHPDDLQVFETVASVAAAAAIGLLAWWATNSTGAAGIASVIVAVVVGVVVGGSALVYLGGQAGARAAARARFGIDSSALRPAWAAAATMAIGVGFIVGGAVLSAVAMDQRDDSTVGARVVSAAEDGRSGGNTYLMEVSPGGQTLTVESERHLRLGSETFVEVGDDGTTRVVGPLDDGRFGVSVALVFLGLTLLVVGVKWYRWTTRCSHLDAVAAAMRTAGL